MRDEVIESETRTDGLWMVQAVIQPFKLDSVTRALESVEGFAGLTVSTVRGFGHERLADLAAQSSARTARETLDDFTGRLRIDVVIAGRRCADDVTATIARAAHTGNRGDGRIFVWPLAQVVRIRTMQEGADAL